jgi:hypothetical protein
VSDHSHGVTGRGTSAGPILYAIPGAVPRASLEAYATATGSS